MKAETSNAKVGQCYSSSTKYYETKIMFLVRCFIICFASIFNYCYAEITQVNAMNDVMKYFENADCNTLAVFDVDMVLVQRSDPAFQMANMKRHKEIARSVSQTVPNDKKEIFLTLMILDSDSILIEDRTPHYIQQLSHRGIPTIALTANLTGQLGTISNLELWKLQRLCNLGIDFRSSAPIQKNHVFVDLPSYRGNFSVYNNGILFC